MNTNWGNRSKTRRRDDIHVQDSDQCRFARTHSTQPMDKRRELVSLVTSAASALPPRHSPLPFNGRVCERLDNEGFSMLLH